MGVHLGGSSLTQLNNAYARLSGVQATRSTDGALVAGSHNPVDASSGNRTVTLADAASAGQLVVVSKKDPSANTVTVSVAHLRDGGAGTIVLVGQYEALTLTSKADGSWWPIGDHKTKEYLTGAFVARKHHNTVTPYSPPGQYSSGRTTCGVDAALGKVWCYNSSGLQQVDALTSTAWSVLTMPTNVSAASQAAKVVTVGTTMFMCSWNTVSSRYEVYSATVGLKSVAPTWSAMLLQLAANATLIPTAMRATSAGSVLIGEYTGTPDITGGPSIYRSTGGAFTRVLQLSTARHIHGIYEDPFNPGTLYATVGDYFGSYAPVSAIYKSTDDGQNWAAVTSVNNAAGNWQAVALGFTSDYIWAVSDQSTGGGPYIMDRATMTPRWASIHGRVDRIPVPGGQGGRWLTDVTLNNASAVLTSASAAFTALDVGRRVMGHNGIPLGTYISGFTSSTQVTLSGGSSTTGTNQTVLIGGDSFYANGYAGAVDPASGYLYYVANDASNAGNTAGLFVLTGPGDRPALVWALPNTPIGNHEVYIAGGYLWVDRVGPMPLLTAV